MKLHKNEYRRYDLLSNLNLFLGISDDTEGGVFANYLKRHSCYEIVPKSAKIVIFDTRLLVSLILVY